MTRSIKRKLIQTRMALSQTVQKILEINRKRKMLSYLDSARTHLLQAQKALNEELRVLNKLAEKQAQLIQHYEQLLTQPQFSA